jgi:tetratricopeptide (TPR) repeat protein
LESQEQKEWQQKKDYFAEQIRANPNDGDMWRRYAYFLRDECDSPWLVVKAFRKASELCPDQDFRLFIGDALVDSGYTEEGLQLLRECVSSDPQAHELCYLANNLNKVERFDEAREVLNQALEIDPDFEEIYFLLGNAYRKSDRHRAIEYYLQAIQRDREYYLAWRSVGALYIAEPSTLDEGIYALREALNICSDEALGHVFLANALWRKGEYDEADVCYQKAIELCPDDPQYVEWRREFLTKTGRA